MKSKIFWKLICSLLIPFGVFSQISISFPTERAVFQRNQNNKGFIQISGSYQPILTRVEARVIPINGGQETPWTTISTNPTGGNFIGKLEVTGGWYRLEVRGLFNERVEGITTINRVGVGEVFLISGQSNARGVIGKTAHPINQDDRVSCITNFFANDTDTPPFPTFAQLKDENTFYAPEGYGSWYWGELGAKLATRLNVPILFINTAWEGLAIDAWRESLLGGTAPNPFSGLRAKPGYPYNSTRYALNYYHHLLGIRAILWSQGESDTFINKSAQEYANDLKLVISETRKSSAKNIAWVVSRTSKVGNRTSPDVIQGQNITISTTQNVFPGPNLDQIEDRYDGTHFNTVGLNKAADEWSIFLNDAFFNSSIPFVGTGFIEPTIKCSIESDVPIQITLNTDKKNINWSNGLKDATIFIKSGQLQAQVVDTNKNVSYSPILFFDQNTIPQKPQISVIGSSILCEGETTTLRSNYSINNVWTSGAITPQIVVSKTTTERVSYTNSYGCTVQSDAVTILVNPKPEPQVSIVGKPVSCSNEDVFLESNLSEGIRWSNGETLSKIKINQTGSYTLQATNEFGCTVTTPSISIFIGDTPGKPTIEKSTPFTLQAVSLQSNSTIEWLSNNGVLTGQNARQLKISQPAEYTAKASRTYLVNSNPLICISEISNAIQITDEDIARYLVVFPIPVTSTSFSVEIVEPQKNIQALLYSPLGQLIRTYQVADFASLKSFSVVGVPKGEYFLQIKNQNIDITKRILIE